MVDKLKVNLFMQIGILGKVATLFCRIESLLLNVDG